MDLSFSPQTFAEPHAIDLPAHAKRRLSEDEHRVIALSHFDRLTSIDGWTGRLARYFADDSGNSLANAKLEELRRFAVVLREYGSPDGDDLSRFIGAGYSEADVVLVRQVLRWTAPQQKARHLPVLAWTLAALVAAAVYAGVETLLDDGLASALAGGASFLMLVFSGPQSSGSKRRAGARSSRRLLPITAVLVAATIVAFTLQSCAPAAEKLAVAPGASENIIVLPDGGTMLAKQGTVNRSMADWIGTADKKGASLTAPGAIFEVRSTRLTQQGLGDAATLANLLRATPDAHILIIGRGDPLDDPVNARLIGQMRSEALAGFLEDLEISPERIRTASKDDLTDDDENQLRLVVWRGLTRRDFHLASR